jgi:xanthine dehydrogenase YagS FAD-binding subunit
MQAFEYASPKTRQEAVKLLASRWGETEVLAGGTDLVSAMKDRVTTPKRLVSLQQVAGLGGAEFSARSGLRLGAMLTLRELMDHRDVQRHYPALVEVAEGIRSEQLRHMGTVGGELLQRPRCWYYRNGYGLLAQFKGKSLVPGGDNRYHAILGNAGPAYFVSPSSLAPILIALGAKVKLFGPAGEREIPLGKFFVTPAREGEREHAIRPDEVLTEILVPAHRNASMAVYEVRQKEGLDWPLAAAAVVLHLEGGRVQGARVVLGHVAPVPWPSPEAEETLRGKRVSDATADAAGQAAVAKATPLSMNGYKVQLARVAVKRAILKAAQGGAHA